MTYLHAFLEIIGAVSLLASIIIVLWAYYVKPRRLGSIHGRRIFVVDDRFNYSQIQKLPWSQR